MALLNTPKLIENLTGTTVSDSIKLRGSFGVSVSGTFTGSITLQRSIKGATAQAVKSYTVPTEDTELVEAMSDVEYSMLPNLSVGSADVVLGDQLV